MKTYQPNETKEQRKQRKALLKQGFSSDTVIEPTAHKNYVVCVKWGTKYPSEYVNRLYNMVQRNLSIDYEFVCFTENSKGINNNIKTYPLPILPVSGWWFKPWLFSDELPIKGTVLFLDLDIIVFESIDKFFKYKIDSNFVIIRDFNRQIRKNWDKMNSSVFRFTTGSQLEIYNEYKQNITQISRKFHGDQDFMYKYIKTYDFWPDEWIQSYKWEMRNRSELGIINGRRNFVKQGHPNILKETSVAVFHGDPNPGDCLDPWVVDNWR